LGEQALDRIPTYHVSGRSGRLGVGAEREMVVEDELDGAKLWHTVDNCCSRGIDDRITFLLQNVGCS
jgi:hypothetical protein